MGKRYYNFNPTRQRAKGGVHSSALFPTSRVTTITTTELSTDTLIVCNSATAITVNLLAASGSNRMRQIANINNGVVTVEGDGGDTINGELNQLLYNGDCMDIKDYAANKWVII